MRTGREAISRREAVLDQLSFLIEELEAQRPWLNRIPEAQLAGKPLETVPSLIEIYQEMDLKERREHLPGLGMDSQEAEVPDGIDRILDSLIQARTEMVGRLRSWKDDIWQSVSPGGSDLSMEEFSYGITQSDAEFLRSIAERLNESMISFSK